MGCFGRASPSKGVAIADVVIRVSVRQKGEREAAITGHCRNKEVRVAPEARASIPGPKSVFLPFISDDSLKANGDMRFLQCLRQHVWVQHRLAVDLTAIMKECRNLRDIIAVQGQTPA